MGVSQSLLDQQLVEIQWFPEFSLAPLVTTCLSGCSFVLSVVFDEKIHKLKFLWQVIFPQIFKKCNTSIFSPIRRELT